jgi:hypothetical protein
VTGRRFLRAQKLAGKAIPACLSQPQVQPENAKQMRTMIVMEVKLGFGIEGEKMAGKEALER